MKTKVTKNQRVEDCVKRHIRAYLDAISKNDQNNSNDKHLKAAYHRMTGAMDVAQQLYPYTTVQGWYDEISKKWADEVSQKLGKS